MNTEYKTRTLPKRLKSQGPEGRLTSHPAPLFGQPWKAALAAPDYTPAAYRRVLSQQTGGVGEWAVLSSAPSLGSQTYPHPDIYRTVMEVPSALAPGCALALRIVAVRSGLTQRYGVYDSATGWHGYGPQGSVRVTVDYENEAAATDQVVVEVNLEPSQLENGAEPTLAGGSWGQLIFKYVPILHPAAALAGDPAEKAKWSERTNLQVTIDHRGGARVIHVSLVEIPHEHVLLHDDLDASIHAWPPSVPPGDRPTTKGRDGSTYDEPRFGADRGLVAAAAQSERLGPLIAEWTAYDEVEAEVTDTTPDPPITGSTFVGLSGGSSIISWSADAPGYDVGGAYARRAPENLSSRVDGAGSIPVRARALVRWTGAGSATGTIRWQSSARSWLDLEVSQASVGTTWTWVTITGWIECGVSPDDYAINLVDFAKRTAGTFQCRAWRLYYEG